MNEANKPITEREVVRRAADMASDFGNIPLAESLDSGAETLDEAIAIALHHKEMPLVNYLKTHKAMTKRAVHIVAVVRVKVADILSSDPQDAILKAIARADLDEVFGRTGQPRNIEHVEYDDRNLEYIVDDLDPDGGFLDSQSWVDDPDGDNQFLPYSELLDETLRETSHWAMIENHKRMEKILCKNKSTPQISGENDTAE